MVRWGRTMLNDVQRTLILASRGEIPADVVYENAVVFNPFTCSWITSDFAVKSGLIAGLGDYKALRRVDLKGRRIVPGLIDAHVHIESSLLIPSEYARLVSGHGTTTVIADPHEIANVYGSEGIEYMLSARVGLPVDIFITLPSCVPATPLDRCGAVLNASDLAGFVGRDGVVGLAEMMNVPGVLNLDPEVWKKLSLFPVVDGHAPLLSGKDLNAYIASGIQSDHESTSASEAGEKLRLGMRIYIREGSTERNLKELIKIVNPCNCSHFSFATDDRHVDMLVSSGHIDDCIRKAVEHGLEPEIAIRMGTLSPAERFSLHDRGALTPGRLADFCVLEKTGIFRVEKVFKQGEMVENYPEKSTICGENSFRSHTIPSGLLTIQGEGVARVIGIVPGQILTKNLEFEIEGRHIPDLERDILKVAVCSRYYDKMCGMGLVHGFGLKRGAIASSISHDSHNIVAVGVHDEDISRAIRGIMENRGGMVAVDNQRTVLLPLECAGLMSIRPYEEVCKKMNELNARAIEYGSIHDPFMYLSFLALTVIPHLRVTERGVFDVDSFEDVPLFRE